MHLPIGVPNQDKQCNNYVMLVSEVGMEGDRGLVAGRSQREKRRSYKDLLREEEEMAAEVRKSSKKRPKVKSSSLEFAQ